MIPCLVGDILSHTFITGVTTWAEVDTIRVNNRVRHNNGNKIVPCRYQLFSTFPLGDSLGLSVSHCDQETTGKFSVAVCTGSSGILPQLILSQ